jgi:hypothetical protein
MYNFVTKGQRKSRTLDEFFELMAEAEYRVSVWQGLMPDHDANVWKQE